MIKETPMNEYDHLKKPISDRIKRMRKEVVAAKPILCSERALLVTESYQETEGKPIAIRRALAFKHILENMTQNIFVDELLVGSHGSNGRRSTPVFPEFAVDWLVDELDEKLETREQDTFDVPAHVKEEIKSIVPYWRGKTVYEKYREMLPDDPKRSRDAYLFSRDLFERNGYGHTAYDLRKLFKIGLKGIVKECKERLETVDLTTNEGIEAKLFYEAIIIECDAVIAFARRYSETAKKHAAEETDEIRKQELLKIADVCSWVPENPARDTWDALQDVVFMQLLIQTETNGDSVSPGRLDQYLYPYYVEDINNGTYDNDTVQELLDCLWLKFNEVIKVQDSESIHIHPGFPMTPNLTIGGQTEKGENAVNELSYLMLNAQEHIRLTNPQFTVRTFAGTPFEFKKRVTEVIKLGTGMPAIFGDDQCINAMDYYFDGKMPIENLRDYAIVGCIELAPRGFQGRVNAGFLNVARIVDLALNNGRDRLTGEMLGLETGDPSRFESFDELFAAVQKQFEYIVHHQVINAAVVDKIQRENTPHIFLSSLIEGCIENGKDMTWGGSTFGATPILQVGLATASDSLAAIKKLVFEESELSIQQINEALDENFRGERNEQIRELLVNAPKYGNDDLFADGVMTDLTNMFFDVTESFDDIDGRMYTSMILTLGGTVPHGWKTGATADGRLATTPVSDSMSPANGADLEGPTAVLLSASRIDQKRLMQGNVLNLKFSKTAFGEADSTDKFVNLIDTYLLDLKGQEIQVNVVDSQTLKAAKQNPDEYRDLVIRVAGYSARFVELAEELQDDIIARTENEEI